MVARRVEPSENEVLQYWSPMFKANKLPSDRLDALLRGIAVCISTVHGSRAEGSDLTPGQLAAFYRQVGGNYDPLFVDMPPQSISYIYKSLGCLHSLQPDLAESGCPPPTIPALKPRGFVVWQTIQLLLGPEEHVPFLQNALQQYNVVDPETGTPFPKTLPKQCFPSKPDEMMVKWHEQVSERLRREALDGDRVEPGRPPTASTPIANYPDGSADERGQHAAEYFSNPQYRNKEGRPGIVRHITWAPVQSAISGGNFVARTVRNIADPNLFGRKSSRQSSRDRLEPKEGPNVGPHSKHNTITRRKGSPHYDDDQGSTSGSEASPRQRRRGNSMHDYRERDRHNRDYFDHQDGHDSQSDTRRRSSVEPSRHRHRHMSPEPPRPEVVFSEGSPFGSKPERPRTHDGPVVHPRPRFATSPSQASSPFEGSPNPPHVERGRHASLTPQMAHEIPRRHHSTREIKRPDSRSEASQVNGVKGRKYPTEQPWV